MLHLQELFTKFREEAQALASRIKASHYKASWFIEGMGFKKSPSAYYRRLNRADWTPLELLKFAYLLEGKNVPAQLTEQQ